MKKQAEQTVRPTVENWEKDDPEVSLVKRGARNLCRKVEVTGIVDLEDDPELDIPSDTLEELGDLLKKRLRQGREVRLWGGVRFYPCTDKSNASKIVVCAQTMGFLRGDLLADKKPRFFRGKSEVDAAGLAKLDRAAKKNAAGKKKAAIPDTMVTCPDCGSEFRVGRQLG